MPTTQGCAAPPIDHLKGSADEELCADSSRGIAASLDMTRGKKSDRKNDSSSSTDACKNGYTWWSELIGDEIPTTGHSVAGAYLREIMAGPTRHEHVQYPTNNKHGPHCTLVLWGSFC